MNEKADEEAEDDLESGDAKEQSTTDARPDGDAEMSSPDTAAGGQSPMPSHEAMLVLARKAKQW